MSSFVDTSGLLKLYIAEIGSLWVRQHVLPAGITISALAIAEAGVALNRRVRERVLSAGDALAAWRTLRRDIRSFTIYRLDRRTLINAAYVASRSTTRLRTLDAIHLQCAIHARVDARARGERDPIFVTADIRLLAGAQEAGFHVENPLSHGRGGL